MKDVSFNTEAGACSLLLKRAVALSWFTIIYNLLEGTISIYFGIADGSISLAGFGVDSLIEVASALIVLWRFQGESKGLNSSLKRERTATFGIGVLFLILAVGTLLASIIQLRTRAHPETTIPGGIVSLASLSFMFFLWRAKLDVARQLNSSAMAKDAACSLACIVLSGVLFAGSVIYFFLPSLWWADGTAAMLLAFLIAREGWETVVATRNPNYSGGCGCDH